MTKLSIRLPSGLEVSFEGDNGDLKEFRGFLEGDLPELVKQLQPSLAPPSPRPSPMPESKATTKSASAAKPAPEPTDAIDLDIGALAHRLDEVDAKTDIERVAVMAWCAAQAGAPGLDSKLANRLYTELAIPKPGVWRSTFQNAKRRGYLKSAAQGFWTPTYAGENLATHGIRSGGAKRK
jgi:hypothetical protein